MKKIDYKLFIAVVILSLFGVLMIFSASSIWAEYKFNDEFKYLKVGDKVKVIYPKENIGEIKRYSFFKIFKTSIALSLIAVFIIFVGTSLL